MENEWILESLTIHTNWSSKGLYCGSVKFKNGIKMEMSLAMDNEAAVKMISLLQDEIKKSAANLSDLLGKSMPIAIPESTNPT